MSDEPFTVFEDLDRPDRDNVAFAALIGHELTHRVPENGHTEVVACSCGWGRRADWVRAGIFAAEHAQYVIEEAERRLPGFILKECEGWSGPTSPS